MAFNLLYVKEYKEILNLTATEKSIAKGIPTIEAIIRRKRSCRTLQNPNLDTGALRSEPLAALNDDGSYGISSEFEDGSEAHNKMQIREEHRVSLDYSPDDYQHDFSAIRTFSRANDIDLPAILRTATSTLGLTDSFRPSWSF
jgi:hypothetical protein